MRLVIALCFLLGIDSWSCSERLTGPRDQAGLRMELRLSSATGAPGHPLSATATVINLRSSSVYHPASCFETGVGLEVLGPDGMPVHLFDPRILPECPEFCCEPLAPRAKIESTMGFDGTLYTSAGQSYQAPAGDYTVVATFAATTQARGGEQITTTRRAVFRWSAP